MVEIPICNETIKESDRIYLAAQGTAQARKTEGSQGPRERTADSDHGAGKREVVTVNYIYSSFNHPLV